MEVTPLALTAPELLKEIFFWSDEQSNCNSNVLVCNTWMEPCLDTIWREVTDLVRLWKILGPIRLNYNGVVELSSSTVPLNWTRFSFYARRVRKIWESGEIPSTFLSDVISQRPSSPLLPHLQILEWQGEIPYRRNPFIMFLEPTLQQFILRSDRSLEDHSSLNGILSTVAVRSPALQHITITTKTSAQKLVGVILEFLQKIPNVSSIELSPFPDMAPFTNALQNFPCLKKLYIRGLSRHDNGTDKPCIQFLAQTPLEGNYFASLTTLDLVAPYSVAGELFAKRLPSLKRIEISSDLRAIETPGTVKHLLENIAAQCPHLEGLWLSYSFLPQQDHSRLPSSNCLVQMDTLRPILSCTKMRNFTFKHPHPITLEDRFAEELATSWPDLEELYLNHAPCMWQKDCFTLRVLITFVQICPRLQYLGLLIASNSTTCPSQAEIEVLSGLRLSRLATFDVGISTLYECDVVQVTAALSLLLPEQCSFVYEEDDDNNGTNPSRKNWNSVKTMIPHVRAMKQESSLEKYALEAEIQSLRAQLKLALAS